MSKQVIDLSEYNIDIGGYTTASSAISLINLFGTVVTDEPYVPTKPIERYEMPRASRLPMLLAGMVAVAVLVSMCINYVALRNDIDTTVNAVAKLEYSLSEIAEENREEYDRIMKSVDLAEIENIAVNELNMVPSDEAEAVSYKESQGEYTRQYMNFKK